MTRPLEENVMSSIDVLFRGAQVLAGGDRHEAERLLEDTVLAADHDAVRSGTPSGGRGLLVVMARTFLAQLPDTPPGPATARHAASRVDLTADGIFKAAARVGPRSRVALWLVPILRWPYADAAAALRVEESTLRGLLGEGYGFMAAFRDLARPEIGGSSR
jgi:DNA-directed RNA polymerase specialized sigma24 family protein